MSSPNPSDPRLLLPEWLREGDVPAAARVAPDPTHGAPVAETDRIAAVDIVEVVTVSTASAPVSPFSDRLSLDTRLDPGQLVSAADLPRWLGGLEQIGSPVAGQALGASTEKRRPLSPVAVDEPEPYDGIEAPEEGAIDVNVNGWIIVGAAVGLLVLLIAAFKLYLA